MTHDFATHGNRTLLRREVGRGVFALQEIASFHTQGAREMAVSVRVNLCYWTIELRVWKWSVLAIRHRP